MTNINYEWNAFAEAEFLNSGDLTVNLGDTFTMLGAVTVSMSVLDNDGSLSGDNDTNEVSGQSAYVDGQALSGKMYAESYHDLRGSDGGTYYMIEIEVESHDAPGVGDVYFTFYGAVPPVGLDLTVTETYNVSGSWVDFASIGASGTAPANTPPTFTNVAADGVISTDGNTAFATGLAAPDAATCIEVSEHQDFTYDVDSTNKLYTEDVWFAKKINCIEISTDQDDVDYAPDQEQLEFSVYINQDNLQAGLPDYDRMIDIDEEAILQAFRDLGLQNVRLDKLDENSDDLEFDVEVYFDGTVAEARAIVADLVFDIKYEDSHGNVKEATICTTVGDEEFDTGSPIAFDLNGTGAIETTGSSTDKAHEYDGGATVLFDIDGDGSKEHIEWMSGTGDGLLIDLSKVGANGQIDGNALFGDQGGQYDHGYEKLSLLDANNDGKVSGGEANDLAIWIDDGDAVLEAGEVVSLASQGISEVSTVMTTTADGRMVSTTVFDAEVTGDVTYSLEGTDAAFFQINSQTGEISWRDGFTPDFEDPQDAGGDNIYNVSVKRSGEFCEDEIQPLQFCVEAKEVTCIEVSELQDFTYDVDSTNKLYTEDVWFAKKIGCIEISTTEDEVDYSPDNEQLQFQIKIYQENLQADIPDYDRMIDVDEEAILQAFRNLGLQNVRLDRLDEDEDDFQFQVQVHFDGTDTEAAAIMANLVFDITYEDVHGNVKEATICTTAGDEDFTSGSPIAFDLNGTDAIETTGSSTDKAHEYDGGATVLFDIDGDGSKEHIEWMSGTGDGLLIDLSKVGANGQIDGNALFGDQGGQFDHGYEKLSLLDANNDGKVSGGEANDLAIWIDDGDAVLEAGEVVSLESQGISEVSTVMTTTADGRMVSTTVFDAEVTGDVTYSLEGTDAAFFQINSQTGEISWRDGFTPDFENPQDAGGDNIYDVSVKRSGEFCEDEIQPLQFCVEKKEVTCIKVCENQDFTYDVDSTNKLYTEDVWFAKKISCIEISTTEDEVDYSPDNEQLQFQIKIYQENLQADIPDYDRMIDVDEEAILQAFRNLGLQNVRLDRLDEDEDDFQFQVQVHFDGTDTEAAAIMANLVFDITYEDVHGNVKEATICTTAGDEDFTSGSPIAFDLNGTDAIETTGSSTDKAHEYDGGATVLFDIDGDGSKEHIEWMSGTGDGLLIDLSKVGANGQIDGNALFGDQGGQFDHGYEKLSLLDANNDGKVSGGEANDLAIWIDDGDAVLEAGEVVSLASQGISEVSTVMTTTADGRMVSTTVFDAEVTGDVTYSLEGADAAFFQINSQTGEISWRDGFTPDFEDPQDAGGDNIYDVSVKRSGEFCEDEIQPLQFCVEDKPEFGSLSGRYFCDENGNNVDDGEIGVAGAIVRLIIPGTGVVATTTTAADGSYRFDDIAAGEYRVRFENPDDVDGQDGKVFVDANVGDDADDSDVVRVNGAGHGNTGLITVNEGENTSDVDAGIKDPGTASLAGRVFIDSNDDNDDDNNGDEDGLGGVTVKLVDGNGDAVLDSNGDAITTETAADGSYAFTGLAAGDYAVMFDTADFGDLVLVDQDAGVDDTSDSDVGADGMTPTVTLAAGGSVDDLDAGVEDPGTASLAGRVFIDSNDDNDDDNNGDEDGLGGVTVKLVDGNGDAVLDSNGDAITTETAADGSYAFTGLAAGDYAVMFDTADFGDLVLVDQDAGVDDTSDSDVGADGMTPTVTLAAGGSVDDLDAGVEDPATASLAGRVFIDSNDDNDDDNNGDEDGLGGVTVKLVDGNGDAVLDSNGDAITTETAADGSYAFTGLAAGDYAVMFDTADFGDLVLVDQDAGVDDTSDSDVGADGMTPTVTLAAGGSVDDLDAGVEDPATASLAGRVFIDSNDDNDDDNNGDEDGLGGVTVKLVDGNGDAVLDSNGDAITTETAADGSYAFTGLAAGDYAVMFDTADFGDLVLVDQDAGVDDTSDSDVGADGMTPTVTLAAGGSVDDLDAGVEDPATASLAGRVFIDSNDDNDDDNNGDEDGLGGVTVKLVDGNGDAVLDSNGDAITTETAADGSYAFTGLAAGDYAVMFDTADFGDLVLVDQDAGVDDTSDSDVGADGMTPTVTLAAGGSVDDLDAGVEDPATAASISGRYFCDTDGDAQDNNNGDEPGVEGAKVMLILKGTGKIDVTFTDADGNYSFEGLDAGEYRVRFIDPEKVDSLTDIKDFVQADQGDDASDSDVTRVFNNGNGQTEWFDLAENETVIDVDAGVEVVDTGDASVGDTVWFDANGDGLLNNGEEGVDGVDVYLIGAGEDGIFGTGDDTTDFTITGPDGDYLFEDLNAGEYRVEFDGSTTGGLDFTTQSGDAADATNNDSDADANGVTGSFTLEIGEAERDIDAGLVDPMTGVIGDYVFCDINGNGIQDGDDTGVGDVGVYLVGAGADGVFGTADDISDFTTTEDDGSYLFENVAAGQYYVEFDGATTGGKVFTTQGDFGSDNVGNDSDADANGVTDVFTMDVGEIERDIDAGLVDPGTASVGDYVWLDADGNGVQNGDEDGVQGVNVQLVGAGADGLFDTADDLIFNDTTDENGNYLFENLKAGEYKIIFDRTSTGDLVFTTQNVAAADAAGDDSDADVNTGMTSVFSLDIGEAELDIDAGLVAVNTVPDPQDDAGMTCADEKLTVAVLENDGTLNFEGDIVDADGDVLTITHVDGQAISEGQENAVTTGAGTIVTLLNGELMFDGEAAYAGLDIGQTALEDITYTVSDGTDSADANVAVTFCGDANSVESLVASIPTGEITYQVQSSNIVLPVEEYAFNVVLSGTGDARFDDNVIFEAYCIDRGEPVGRAEQFVDAPLNTGVLIGSGEANAGDVFNVDQVSFFNGQSAADNLDLINYILNEDYENNGFTGWEVQRAIWELTDGDDLEYLDGIDAGFGLDDNVDFILSQAAANGEGFVAGVGDKIGIIIDPGHADSSNLQPFIIAIDFEDYDCIC